MNKRDLIERKLAILKTGRAPVQKNSDVKSKDERQKFWSTVMDAGENDAVKLKASELLGKSEADFTENVNHKGEGGVAMLPVMPMSLKGLNEAFARTIDRIEGEQGIRKASNKLLADCNVSSNVIDIQGNSKRP